jgi:hypothetical protein
VPVERAVYIGVRSRGIRQVKEWNVLPSVPGGPKEDGRKRGVPSPAATGEKGISYLA